jgi:hypothetical protein
MAIADTTGGLRSPTSPPGAVAATTPSTQTGGGFCELAWRRCVGRSECDFMAGGAHGVVDPVRLTYQQNQQPSSSIFFSQ